MLKILAIVSMLIDHIGRIFYPDAILFTIIGRLSFPLFCWSVVVGVDRTQNIQKYSLRVLYLALISQIPYSLLFDTHGLNVCFTLLFGILVIMLYRVPLNLYLKWIAIILLLVIPDLLSFDYGSYGVFTILLLYLLRNKSELLLISYTLLTILSISMYHYELIQLYAIMAIPIIIFLKNNHFNVNRFFNYSFYPAHLLLLLCIHAWV
ncbi:TraX family protein [Paenibacillus graminis]|uniref:Conjugal transfer protein TraX n=1 Tax=Paenibacillus graminis TaxID=189425 RepID=A0A089NRA0_9BACL|nr:TraX family protein [Paenibacillus graminis]AIQ71629.1 hypothetical protein PGRAT_31620 [Paenibacillus graminis]